MSASNSRASVGEPSDPAEAIIAALARLRGRRGGGLRADGSHDPAHDVLHAVHHGPGGGRGALWGHRGPAGAMPPWAGDPDGRHGAPALFRMLEALSGADLSVSALGAAIGVDQPRASRLVQQGADRGWVRREADPGDARRTRIALTDEGRRLIGGVRGRRRQLIDEALDALTPPEREELARLLTKLADNWPG